METWATLVEIIKGDKILLKRATRGISKGKWNGLGGKIEAGETPEQSATREVFEESGLKVKNLFHHGVIGFHNVGKDKTELYGHIFSTRDFSGQMREKGDDGGELKWFPINAIPLGEMWEDDKYWFPHMLEMKKFDADFYFEGDKITRHEIKLK